jgi:hypothetical protein
MDHAQITQLAEEHGRAVIAHDDERVITDIIAELHPLIPQLAAALPDPLTGSRVVSVIVFDDHAETLTQYSGPVATVTVKARWEDRGDGRPQIVSASPV